MGSSLVTLDSSQDKHQQEHPRRSESQGSWDMAIPPLGERRVRRMYAHEWHKRSQSVVLPVTAGASTSTLTSTSPPTLSPSRTMSTVWLWRFKTATTDRPTIRACCTHKP
ncbi:unnamed protein product [Clonostachys rhizophaga]|uniref:Uncharacterized protein n=1 Tax=Clonostachys rhizophaga TaxID=160324 RepID=A0A9N9V5C3_9HYPO|nr:unnamed protein product [Clonostachys rhizophaga]